MYQLIFLDKNTSDIFKVTDICQIDYFLKDMDSREVAISKRAAMGPTWNTFSSVRSTSNHQI